MKFVIENWFLIIIAVSVVSVAGIAIYRFLGLPTKTQLEKIKEWLLYAVTKAESELGSGTGTLKLRAVYDMFLATFPDVAKWISFEKFSNLVDCALKQMRENIEKNQNIKNLVDNGQV